MKLTEQSNKKAQGYRIYAKAHEMSGKSNDEGLAIAKKKIAKIKAEKKSNVISAAEQKTRAATRARQEAKLAKRKAGMPKKRPSGISTKPVKTVKDGNQGVRKSVSSGAGTKPKKKGGIPKALVGKQNKLPDAIKKAIKAAPETKKGMPKYKKGMTKKSGLYMVKSMGSAGMVGKAGTAKPPGGPKRKKSTTARNR